MQESFIDEVLSASKISVVLRKILIFNLLLSPLIMGVMINSLGNAGPIKKKIYIQFNGIEPGIEPTQEEIQTLPPYLWALRFLFPVGGVFGSVLAGYMGNKLGRRLATGFFLLSIIFGSCIKLASYYTHFALIFVGCFFDGTGASGIMVVDLMLMWELMSSTMTKISKPLVQIFINLGILLIAGITLNSVAGNNYHFSFLFPVFLSIINSISLLALPESPVYTYEKTKNGNKVAKDLVKVHGSDFVQYLNHIIASVNASSQTEHISILGVLRNPRYRGPIVTSIFLHCAQQLSGINAIMAFAPDVLSRIGLSSPDTASLIILSVALVGSIMFSPFVALFRRKIALLIGHGIMGCSLIAVYLCFYYEAHYGITIYFLSLFVFIFQIGPGPLVWFITLEIFPPSAVNAAQSICVCANWISNALVFAIADLGLYVFIGFAVVNVFIFIYMFFFVAETIGRESDNILDEYAERYSVFPCCKIVSTHDDDDNDNDSNKPDEILTQNQASN